VVGDLNCATVHVTQASGGVWYVTLYSDLDTWRVATHDALQAQGQPRLGEVMLGSPGRLPDAAVTGLVKR